MPIDTLKMLEFFAEKVVEPSVPTEAVRFWQTYGNGRDSYFDDLWGSEFEGGGTLAQLIGEQKNLLLFLAQRWENDGKIVPAEIVREIETFLASQHLELEGDPSYPPRLLDYVYPVV